MLRALLTVVYFLLGMSIGIWLFPEVVIMADIELPKVIGNLFVYGAVGGLLFLAATAWSIPWLKTQVEKLEKIVLGRNITEIFFASIGMLFGLLVAVLLTLLINTFNIPVVNEIFPIISAVILGYLGFQVGLKKFGEVIELFQKSPKSTESISVKKLVDTSAIIDGRILDVLSTGFLEGEIIIPQFVLDELQLIADSTDHVKREKGQRGLDVLNQLRTESEFVSVRPVKYDKLDVDHQLIELANEINAAIITTDYNLNRVAQVHNIKVLNVNELQDSLKLMLTQGDIFKILITKTGKEKGQGVGYLEDGTMVVVDDADMYINELQKVQVTSILQTNSGRIIFTKLAN
ncbi:PIN/TRAM domain-containing protein [Phocicoccus schoeneichii]|uniref:Putative PIN and TRAM-domain containing protein n=1 Tax=Phocicoccus schoeneichii TaxID=1812261 RepID=A0A6V7R070_9BACL|nr:PIN domain-containing protein [Jeotgalicoccus schoeneichii]GGH54465.1 PIN/TRAM domain-containing protein [Jeotgalicoccus schoeneichii]CAD2070686.1 putative PIN and TRAM-domain containing protein precursor [Jeotgalicoccus schoeneichii]